jgi:hypothetical protein
MDGICGRNERDKVLGTNPEGRTPLGRTRYRWEDTIGICLKGIGR